MKIIHKNVTEQLVAYFIQKSNKVGRMGRRRKDTIRKSSYSRIRRKPGKCSSGGQSACGCRRI